MLTTCIDNVAPQHQDMYYDDVKLAKSSLDLTIETPSLPNWLKVA